MIKVHESLAVHAILSVTQVEGQVDRLALLDVLIGEANNLYDLLVRDDEPRLDRCLSRDWGAR